MEKQYKILFFDWHKTLSFCDFWVQLKDLTHERNHWHENIIHFLFTENKPLIQRWMRGETDEENILQMVSDKFSYPLETLREDLAESCRAMTLNSDETLPLVTKLRERGIQCVIATDNMDVFKKYVVPALKLNEHFDDVLVSFDQKALKFDASQDTKSLPFFENYLQSKGLRYSEALLLDDRRDESGIYEELGFDIFRVEDSRGLLDKMNEIARV